MRRLLIGISLVAGGVYLLIQPWAPFVGSALPKAFAMAPLAALSFWLARTYGRPLLYLGIAQALSCAGDVLLDLGPDYFTFGLAAFLLAHVEYTTLWLMFRPRPFRSTPVRGVVAAAVLVFAIAIGWWLVPGLGEMSAPVGLYIFAIAAMVISACLSRFPLGGVGVGALLFLISDSVLAVDRFKFAVPGRGFLVWSTYYTGQLLIALSAMRALTHTPAAHDKLPAGAMDVRHHSTKST